MKAIDRSNDQTICWTMRIVGIILTVAAGVLLAHDIFNTPLSVGFLSASAGLGVITTAISLLPANKHLQESAVPARAQTGVKR